MSTWSANNNGGLRGKLTLLLGGLAAASLIAGTLAPSACGGDSQGQSTQNQSALTGARCSIGGNSSGGQLPGTVLNLKSADCASSICLLMASGQSSTPAQPLCTKSCTQDSDCPGATAACPGGFSCGPAQVVGGFNCCPLCLCKDFLKGGTSPYTQACAGRTPQCPN